VRLSASGLSGSGFKSTSVRSMDGLTNRRGQGSTGFCEVGGEAGLPSRIKRHRLDSSERRALIGGVDSDTLMTLRLAAVVFLQRVSGRSNRERGVLLDLSGWNQFSRCDSCPIKSQAAGVLPVVPLAQRQRQILLRACCIGK